MDEKRTQLTEIAGQANVFDGPEISEPFSLAHRLTPPLQPRFLVKPQHVDQVQKLVLWANETHTPLAPVSSGEPHLRGDSAPTAPETVLVDLSEMQRILKIDRRTRLALIEPGVTYTQLQPELAKEGLRLIAPLLPRNNKSVIASLLEREPVMSPRYHWNPMEPLRSLEIVWGNGDKFYSGSGTFRGEKDEDWQEGKVPLVGPGPAQLDFYKFVSAAQGSMGIVTWASVKCEVFAEARKLFLVPAESLAAVIDFTYKLLKFRFGDELFIVNNTSLACILAQEPDKVAALQATLPAWTVVVGLTGGHILPQEKVEAQENDVRDIAQQSGLKMLPAVPGCRGGKLLDLILEPSAAPYWKLRHKGSVQELFFLTTLDKTPGFVTAMHTAANEHRYPATDIGVYIQPLHQGVSCHCEFMLPFDRESEADTRTTEALFRDASRRLFKQGAFFSRPYGIWAEMVYNADAATTMATHKVKDIFDPRHIMNPGKLCF